MLQHTLSEVCAKSAGTHNILVYDDIEAFRECYCEAAKHILPSSEILLILTYFDTIDRVKFYLREVGVDVDYYSSTDSLFIIDSVQQFFGSEAVTVIKFIELLNKRSRREGRQGVTAIVDMDVFFHLHDDSKISAYESLISPTGNEARFSCLLCAYHRDNFDRLDEAVRRSILAQHSTDLGAPRRQQQDGGAE